MRLLLLAFVFLAILAQPEAQNEAGLGLVTLALAALAFLMLLKAFNGGGAGVLLIAALLVFLFMAFGSALTESVVSDPLGWHTP